MLLFCAWFYRQLHAFIHFVRHTVLWWNALPAQVLSRQLVRQQIGHGPSVAIVSIAVQQLHNIIAWISLKPFCWTKWSNENFKHDRKLSTISCVVNCFSYRTVSCNGNWFFSWTHTHTHTHRINNLNCTKIRINLVKSTIISQHHRHSQVEYSMSFIISETWYLHEKCPNQSGRYLYIYIYLCYG